MKLETKITYLGVNHKGVGVDDKSLAKVRREIKACTPKAEPWHIIKRTETLSLVDEGRGNRSLAEIDTDALQEKE
jgi:hypothetical protein